MRFGVGVRFPSPGTLALAARTFARSRVIAGAGGVVALVGRASSRLTARPGLGSVPVITVASFSIGTNSGFNALVGTVNATNNPTSFAIISGNTSGFFSIANNGTLRTSASAAPPDNIYALTVTASNSFGTSAPVTITVSVGAVPVVAGATLNLTLPASVGALVGTVATSAGTPTSFSITAGNASGFFAISNGGDIAVTSAGASGLTAQTYSLTVQATNARGSGTGSVSIEASATAPAQADFRSTASVVFGSRTNTTITKPTGTADGDIMIAELFVGRAAGAPAVTPPAGWTAIGSPTSVTDTGGFGGNLHLFWKRANSEGSSYTFTHAAASSEALIASYFNCVPTGSPIGATSSNTGQTGTTATATSITTTAANSRVLYVQHGWSVALTTPPAGMTERFDSLIYLSDYLVATTSATGSKTGNVGEAPWAARLVELKAGTAVPLAPSVANQAINMQLPAVTGAGVGIVVTTGGTPTSFSITAGDSAGYFAIDNNGSITVTSAGATGITAQTYALTVQATNAVGSGSGTVSVVASSFVWPNASNTGITPGTVLTNYTGPGIINTPGTVVEGKIFPNGIEVTAANVTFRNCLFTGQPAWQLNGDTARDLLVEDCEFRGGVQTILGQGIFRRLNIWNCSIGMTLKDGQSTVTRCFIHDLAGAAGTHFDGIFISGGQTNCLVEDCWIDVPSNGGTADIFIATRWQGSNIVNTTVNHCRLLGAPSFAMYSEQTSVATITGTRWTNNEVQRGGFGYWAITGNTVFRSGNKDAFTGVNIDNQ